MWLETHKECFFKKAKENMKHEAIINSILKTWWRRAFSLWIIFCQSSQLVRKWKELFGKKTFHKQRGLCNNLKHPADVIAKYITVLCIVSYFAIIYLSSETIHNIPLFHSHCHCHCPVQALILFCLECGNRFHILCGSGFCLGFEFWRRSHTGEV